MQGCLLAQAQGATACTTHLETPAGLKGPVWRQKKEESNTERCNSWVCMSRHHWAPTSGHTWVVKVCGFTRMETALLLQHTYEHPPQLKAKVGDECKPVFCARGRQEPLKESGAALEPGLRPGKSALCCYSHLASRSPWQRGFHPTAQLDLFFIFILQDMF